MLDALVRCLVHRQNCVVNMGNSSRHARLVVEDPTVSPNGRRHCGRSSRGVGFAALFAWGCQPGGI